MPRQILTLFSAELVSNSSCSVEPLAQFSESSPRAFVFRGRPDFLGDLNKLVTL